MIASAERARFVSSCPVIVSPRALVARKGYSRHVAGTVELAYGQIAAKLGRAATLVWEWLALHRHPWTGLALVTVRNIAGGTGLTPRNVRNALERLRAAKLVEDRRHRRDGFVWKLVRYVRGVPATGSLSVLGRCLVPGVTAKWMMSAFAHGGRRAGAGRPKEARMAGNSSGAAGNSSGAAFSSLSPSEKGTSLSFPSEKKRAVPLAPDVDRRSRERHEQPYASATADHDHAGVMPRNVLPPLASPTQQPSSPAGTRQQPRNRPQALPASPQALPAGSQQPSPAQPSPAGTRPRLPDPAAVAKPLGDAAYQVGEPRAMHPAAMGLPFPGVPGPLRVHEIARCVVPNPPLLDPRASPEQHARILARWYTGIAERRTGKTCWSFRGKPLERSRYFGALQSAAKAMVEHEIAPAAWIAWSFDVWEHREKDKLPPPSMVFSAKRIEERRGWFRSCAVDYSGGQQVYVPAARELMQRQAQMRNALARERPRNTEAVLAVVAKYFPIRLRERLIHDAKQQAEAEQERMTVAVAEGKWVW